MRRNTTKIFGSSAAKVTKLFVYCLFFWLLPFSLFAQKPTDMCQLPPFEVSGELTEIKIDEIIQPKRGKDFGEVIVIERDDNTGFPRKTAAIISVTESGTYKLSTRILYSDNNVEKQFNESFFLQICDGVNSGPCSGNDGVNLDEVCVLPCNPNAGRDRVVIKDKNVTTELRKTEEAGVFVLEAGRVYSIWINHFSLIAADYRKFINPRENNNICGPEVPIDSCFTKDSVHLLGLIIEKLDDPEPSDVQVTKTVDKLNAQPGDTLTYSLTMTNVSDTTVYNVKLVDDISDLANKVIFNRVKLTSFSLTDSVNQAFEPSGSSFFKNRISITPQVLEFSPADTTNINLAAKDSIKIEYEVTLKDASFFSAFPDTLFNFAEVTGSCEDNLANNEASTMVVVTDTTQNYDLKLTKRVDPESALQGERFKYELTITNNGPYEANSIEVTDFIPDTVVIDTSTFSVSPVLISTDSLRWELGNLASGDSVQIHFDASLPASIDLPPGKYPFNNTGFVSAPRDTSDLNNRDVARVEVEVPPVALNFDLEIKKTVTPDSVQKGDVFEYSLTIINKGSSTGRPVIAESIIVTDFIPDTVVIDTSTFSIPPVLISTDSLRWELGNLASGDSVQIHFDASVSASVDLPPGKYPFNNTGFVSALRDTSDLNNRDVARVEVEVPPVALNFDLEIKKTVTPDSVQKGDVFEYSLTIINKGSSTGRPVIAESIIVTDFIPDTVVIDTSTFSIPPVLISTDSLWWELGNLASGDSVQIHFDASVPASVDLPPGKYPFNNISFVSALRDTSALNNRDVARVEVDVEVPPSTLNYALELKKTVSPQRILQGTSFEYVITIINHGSSTGRPVIADSIIVTDFLPDTVVTDIDSLNIAPLFTSSDSMKWQLNSLASGDSIEIRFKASVPTTVDLSPGEYPFNNTGLVKASRDTTLQDNRDAARVVVTAPDTLGYDLEIVKTALPVRVNPDSTFEYVLTITNHGPGVAKDILVSDAIPDSVSIDSSSLGGDFSSRGDSLFWNIDSLAANTSEEIRFAGFVSSSLNLIPNKEYPFINTGFVNAPLDFNSANNSDTTLVIVKDTLGIPPLNYGLEIKKTVTPALVKPGEPFEYVITVINHGSSTGRPVIAESIVVTDFLPDTLAIDTDSFDIAPFLISGDSMKWQLDGLASGDSVEIRFKASVPTTLDLPPGEYPFNNTGLVKAPRDTTDFDNQKNARVVVSVLDTLNYALELKKTASPSGVQKGELFEYVITVINHGSSTGRPVIAESIVVTDFLPDTLAIDTDSFDIAPFLISGDSLKWELASLASGDSVEIRFKASVPTSVDLPPGEYPFNNTGFVNAERDTTEEDNEDGARVIVRVSSCDLELYKTVNLETVGQGERFEYRLEVRNKGEATAKDIALWDIISDSIQVDFESVSMELFSNNNDTLMWMIDSLAAGNSALVTFAASVPVSLELTGEECIPISNTSTVYAACDSDRSNNSANADVCVTPKDTCSYDLQLTKTVMPDTIYQGQEADFQIEIRNNSDDCSAQNIQVVDAVDPGLRYSSFEPQPEDQFATDSLRWEITALGPGESLTISYTVLCEKSDISQPERFINTACLKASKDIEGSNNCDQAVLVCEPLTNCLADPSSFYLDRNIFEPGKLTSALPQDLVITINFSEPTSISLDIFDITGYKIKRLAEGLQLVGENSYTWDGRTDRGEPAGSGVYLVFVRDSETGGRILECYLKVIVVQ